MDPLKIIQKYYDKKSVAYEILCVHSAAVAKKALALADRVAHLNPDRQFIREAAMLHDIGMIKTNAPKIGCHGEYPYIMHGILGREMLDTEGLPRHALVCERHTGVGITAADIEAQNLPLPKRDFVPVTLEEQIICFADKFFSKNPAKLRRERSIEEVKRTIYPHGEDKVKKIDEWVNFFNL